MKFNRVNIAVIIVLMAFISFQIISCGSKGGMEDTTGGDTGGAGASASIANTLSLSLSQTSVKSDNSDSSIITATVLDSSNVPIEGITVTFEASGGQISAASVNTDANGEATITFSSGTVEKKNQVVTIEASVSGLSPVQIPIQVIGTSVTLSPDKTALQIDGDATAILTITVRDASSDENSNKIYNAEVYVSVDSSSKGAATLSPTTGKTDVNGMLEVEVTGTAEGDVTVIVEALGATATQTFTVGAIGEVFSITDPSEDPVSLSTNTDLTITVKAPNQNNVVFATTLGTWDGGSEKYTTKPVDGNDEASAVLNSPDSGVATVQVYDADNPSTSDMLTVAISAPRNEANQISLQTSSTVVAPSTGGVSNAVNLTATVRTADDQPVGNAPVAFSIENPTGGGESVSPVIVFTNDQGIANSMFTSGSSSSGAKGVTINAKLVDFPNITDSCQIVIGGTAGSVVIGQSTKIQSNDTNTSYILPMSVLVADSNGNPVPYAYVTLSTWPTRYKTGYWKVDGTTCSVAYLPYEKDGEYTYDNEDKNRNLSLDDGEDINKAPEEGDGVLTPHNSVSGTVPATVTTDENGVANFDLVYLKQYSVWVEAEIKASTLVLGTETLSTLTFFLPYQEGEECNLSDSPFNWADFPTQH